MRYRNCKNYMANVCCSLWWVTQELHLMISYYPEQAAKISATRLEIKKK